MITAEQITIARKNWQMAAQNLGFKIVTPYLISINGSQKEVFAFLPEYGSPNGAIIELTFAPEYKTDKSLIEWAIENNSFYSFINVDNVLEYDQEYFSEVLADWMKYS
jgi:hypothetical protein